jgi:hypothetical protein
MRKAMQRQYLKRRVSQNFATKVESSAKNKFAKIKIIQILLLPAGERFCDHPTSSHGPTNILDCD